MNGKKLLPALLALVLALMSGCMIPSGDELLAAPKPSANYQNLQNELEKLLASGVTYAAPAKGENRSSIQRIDLDGDGVDEAITFFRGANSATSNNFEVFVYKKQDDDKYVCTGSIQGSGTAIQSVEYPAITPAGKRGMLIAWQLQTEGTNALTMCDFDENCVPGVLLETEYIAMELTDLTSNGAKDLLLLTNDQNGKRVARMYGYSGRELRLAGEAASSEEIVSVERIKNGRVKDGVPAVFAEGKTASGVGLSTDIFVYSHRTLRNLALDGEDNTLMSTYRPVSVYSMDINSDGVTELPRAVLMAGYTDASSPDAVFMLDWYVYSVDKSPELVRTTYQNISDAWTFRIDDAWHDVITASKSNESSISTVSFYECAGEGRIELFSISCATGTIREYYADRTDLVQLGQTSKAVYYARLPEQGQTGTIKLSELDLKARFSLVTQDWSY